MIALLQQHDERGMDALLLHCGPLMRYIIAPIVPNALDREECLSEASLRVWNKIAQFDAARGSWSAWLTAVTRNTALNFQRSAARHGDTQTLPEDAPSPEASPEEALLQAERRAALHDALARLGQNDRALFYRKYYYLQSTAQIAAELGMTSTHFKNASGLDAEGHFTTARDIAKMSAALLAHERIRSYSTVWMDSLRGGKTQLVNTNKLVRFYKGATGLKTGTTTEAGRCVSASATRGDMSVIAVVLGAESRDAQFSSAAALMNYAFDSYTMTEPPDISEQLRPVRINGGVLKEVTPVCARPERLLVRKGAEKTLEQTVELPESIDAPLSAGDRIGRVVIRIGGEEVGEYALTSPCDVGEMTFGRAFGILFSALL